MVHVISLIRATPHIIKDVQVIDRVIDLSLVKVKSTKIAWFRTENR